MAAEMAIGLVQMGLKFLPPKCDFLHRREGPSQCGELSKAAIGV